jgi:hypothetical protein
MSQIQSKSSVSIFLAEHATANDTVPFIPKRTPVGSTPSYLAGLKAAHWVKIFKYVPLLRALKEAGYRVENAETQVNFSDEYIALLDGDKVGIQKGDTIPMICTLITGATGIITENLHTNLALLGVSNDHLDSLLDCKSIVKIEGENIQSCWATWQKLIHHKVSQTTSHVVTGVG